jgi:hypothetical protein
MFKYSVLPMLLLLPIFLHCQTWERTISHGNSDVLPYELHQSYDKGFVLNAGIAIGNLVKIGWIIKMDVNGTILWDKKIGNGSNLFGVHGFDKTPDGGLILTGTTDTLNFDNWDPFVIKLNSCGAVEWCRVFQTDMKTDFGTRIRSLPDNSYVLLVFDWKEDMTMGTFLYHLSESGELLWEQEYFATDTLVHSEFPRSLELTPDNSFLITGYCYAPDSGQSMPSWVRPMVIMADSSGDAILEIPWGYANPFPEPVSGEGFQSVIANKKIYSCISNYHGPNPNYAPCLIKTSMSGLSEFYHDIKDSTLWGKASTLNIVNDSMFIAGLWYAYNDTIGELTVAMMDTNGVIQKESVLKENLYIPMDAVISSDQKYLIIAQDEINNRYVIKLWKLNMDLEYDTIYTQSYTYDSLCDHPIISETLLFPCDLIVGIRETATSSEKMKMVVYPNPATDALHVKIPECIQLENRTANHKVITTFHSWYNDLTLMVTDLKGDLILEQAVHPEEKEVTVSVDNWPPGIYLCVLKYNGKKVATERVMVR